MGQRNVTLAQVLGLVGWSVASSWFETIDGLRLLRPDGIDRHRLLLVVQLRRDVAPRCERCGAAHQHVHGRMPSRRVRDLPCSGVATLLEFEPLRLRCPHCPGVHIERLPLSSSGSRMTRRMEQQLAVEASAAPVSFVAANHGLSWGAVFRAEQAALLRWVATREMPLLRMIGLDEKWLGRRGDWPDRFVTLPSNLETGEPLAYRFGRGAEAVKAWLSTLSSETKAGIRLFAMDMHEPFCAAIADDPELAHAALVHDPFHVMKRANELIDELRRATFHRASAELRKVGSGSRWLFLRAEERLSADQRTRLRALLKYNATLARAYQLKEELRAVLASPTRPQMAAGLARILRRTQQRRCVPLRKLHDTLRRRLERILALAEHRPPTGRIEALNNNWETLVRRGRGYRNLDAFLLKLRFMIVNPIDSRSGLRRFLALAETSSRPAAAA